MNYDQFVGEVQHKARLGSSGQAVSAIRATLTTLAERLSPGMAENLAAQLPPEIGRYLLDAKGPQRFSPEELVDRVAEREVADPPRAAYHIRAVLDVLRGAVSEGQWEKVRAQLPEEWEDIIAAGPFGEAEWEGEN
ncbi:MAG: DUF2267 domain-containing protein [Bacillota bacterium]|nr:DUF2267 domain-containing protein [Bacillota bacterium]